MASKPTFLARYRALMWAGLTRKAQPTHVAVVFLLSVVAGAALISVLLSLFATLAEAMDYPEPSPSLVIVTEMVLGGLVLLPMVLMVAGGPLVIAINLRNESRLGRRIVLIILIMGWGLFDIVWFLLFYALGGM